MLLLDEVLEEDKGRLVATKKFRSDEFFFQGHYPDEPIVPGVILCESAMQAGAVLLSSQMDDARGVPVATRLDKVKFRRVVRPGDVLTHEITLNERLANAFFLSAKSSVDGQVSVRFDFACTVAEVQS